MKTKTLTPVSNLFWLNIFEPRADLSGKQKYSATAIFSKDDLKGYEDLMKALRETYEAGREKLKNSKGQVPAFEEIRLPLRDGDEDKPGHPAYENSWFLTAKSDFQPAAVDRDCREITDENQLYNGIRGRLSVTFFCYAFGSNRGIGCSLSGIQKLADMEGCGSMASRGDEFRDGLVFDESAFPHETELPF